METAAVVMAAARVVDKALQTGSAQHALGALEVLAAAVVVTQRTLRAQTRKATVARVLPGGGVSARG